MKNTNLFIGFGLVLIVNAIAFYYLLEENGTIALITGALAGLGLISMLVGFLGKKNKSTNPRIATGRLVFCRYYPF